MLPASSSMNTIGMTSAGVNTRDKAEIARSENPNSA
jgi:hypothetical protein